MANDPGFLAEWQLFTDKVRRFYAALPGIQQDEKDIIMRASFNLSDMLSHPSFPIDVRETLLREAYEILGVDEIFRNPNLVSTITGEAVTDIRDKSLTPDDTLLRYIPGMTPDDSYRSFILRQLTLPVSRSRARAGFGEEGIVRLSRNLPTAEWVGLMTDAQSGALSGLPAGKTITILDTETAGLSKAIAGIHEAAWWTGDTSSFGATAPTRLSDIGASSQATYRIPRLEYGRVWNEQRGYQSINDLLARTGQAMAPGDGDEFLRGISPLLTQLQQSDYIVGQNVAFDIEQIMQNAMRTRAYQQGLSVDGIDVRTLIDDIMDNKIMGGSVIDTASLISSYSGFADKPPPLAPELLARGAKRPRSLENLVLSTNLVDLMESDGVDIAEFWKVGQVSTAGQHSAAFDTQLTGYVLRYMQSGQLKASSGVGLRSQAADATRRAIRFKTVTAGAYTPITGLDVSDISPELFEAMARDGDVRVGKLGHAGSYSLDEIYSGMSMTEIRADLADSSTSRFMVGSVTPLEQGAWAQRQIANKIAMSTGDPVDAGRILPVANMWQFLTGMGQPANQKVLTGASKLFKFTRMMDEDEFSSVKNAWRTAGLPFSDLAMEERILTGAVTHAGTKKSRVANLIAQSVPDEVLSTHAQDLGVLRFAKQGDFDIHKSGKVSMPLEVLRAAAEEDSSLARFAFGETSGVADEGVRWLNFSVTDQPAHKGVGKVFNVGVDLSEEQAQGLARWIGNISDDTMIGEKTALEWGLSASKRADLMSHVGDMHKWGLTVGFLDQEAADFAAEAFHDLFQERIRDSDRLRFAMPFLGQRDGMLLTGPVMSNAWMSEDETARLSQQVEELERIARELSEQVMANPRVGEVLDTYNQRLAGAMARTPGPIRDALEDGSGVVSSTVNRVDPMIQASRRAWGSAEKVNDAYRYLTRDIGPKMAIGALVIGAAAWAFSKGKEEDYYGDTLNVGGYEGVIHNARAAEQVRMGTELYGYGVEPERIDHLATAGVVFNEYNNRINHTSMGTKKYERLQQV